MNSESLVLFKELRSTAETEEGPLIEQRPGRFLVRYDLEGSVGIDWVAIQFDMTFASRFTPDQCCTRLMIGAYSKLCVVEGSSWLSDLRAKSLKSRRSVSGSLRHFIIYFDHYGCIEVVADDAVVLGDK